MSDIAGWAVIGIVFSMIPILLIGGLRRALSGKPIEEKYRDSTSGGIAGGFDAVWSPTANEADQERDRQQRASVPAPTPDKGPDRMDEGRITIELG